MANIPVYLDSMGDEAASIYIDYDDDLQLASLVDNRLLNIYIDTGEYDIYLVPVHKNNTAAVQAGLASGTIFFDYQGMIQLVVSTVRKASFVIRL